MTTRIIDESRTPERLVLAEKIVSPAQFWKPYRVKITETHFFKDKESCMKFFHQARAGEHEML